MIWIYRSFSLVQKIALRLENFLKEKNASALISIFQSILSIFSSDNSRKLNNFSVLVGHFPRLLDNDRVLKSIQNWARHDERVHDVNLSNSIVIKPFVSAKEKGILLISFERELEKICKSSILKKIESRFYIIFIPSWSGLFSPSLFSLSVMSSQIFFIMPVHKYEHKYAVYLGTNCIPLNFNAASWVNDRLYKEQVGARDIDCLIVANFAKFKRHWLLFDAVSKVSREIKVFCVGVPWGGRGREEIEKEAKLFGVSEKVTVVEAPEQEILRDYFSRAKYFCAMSYREGSFIAVAEALIAGTPVLMLKNSFIGTKSLLNEKNSYIVSSTSELVNILNSSSYKFDNYYIKKESIKKFSSRSSCRKLNDELIDGISREGGMEWTSNILSFYSVRLSFLYSDAYLNNDKELHHLEFDGFVIDL